MDPQLARARDGTNRAVLEALTTHGIREPARSRLAQLAHVNEELVRYHCATAPSRGAAIYRIENDWPIRSPDSPESGDRRRYVSGRYGKFVEH